VSWFSLPLVIPAHAGIQEMDQQGRRSRPNAVGVGLSVPPRLDPVSESGVTFRGATRMDNPINQTQI
jgi:hypothetical protein